jgi:starvation-inducible outer membrane lipoprotein
LVLDAPLLAGNGLLETADYAEVVTVVGTVEPEERGR